MGDEAVVEHRERTPEELAAMLVTLLDVETLDTDLYRGPASPAAAVGCSAGR